MPKSSTGLTPSYQGNHTMRKWKLARPRSTIMVITKREAAFPAMGDDPKNRPQVDSSMISN
jgi:hypothetical protein